MISFNYYKWTLNIFNWKMIHRLIIQFLNEITWKFYQQQGAQLKDSSQGDDFIFGENNNYHQIGNGYLKLDITLEKTVGIFNIVDEEGNIDEPIRLVNKTFACVSSAATT